MAATLTTAVASAYASTEGTPSLDVIPGLDGSGAAPILSLPITEDSDMDELLREHGWETVNVTPVGAIRQSDAWTDAGDFSVATVVPVGTDTRCPECGRNDRWVVDADQQVICDCSIDES